MDSPSVKVQRHHSLPGHHHRNRSTRRTAVFLNRRSNPYVGWFRHSPPSSQPRRRYTVPANTGLSFLYKESPYVGFLRHAPSEKHSSIPSLYEKLIQDLLSIQDPLPKKCKNGLFHIKDLLSGHLRGGGATGSAHCRESSAMAAELSSSLHVLSRLAHWVLEPFQRERRQHSSSFGSIEPGISLSCDNSAAGSESYSNDDHDFPYGHFEQCGQDEIEGEISTQILKEEEDRLDYVITQMDIMRMNRNASRHLDVDSIVKLPTTVYSKSHCADGSFSWMLVDDTGSNEKSTTEEEEENSVCVICLEHYNEGDHLRVLPCNHSFHVGCIDRWLSGSCSFEDCYTSGCPTCKKQVTVKNGSVPSWSFTNVGSVLLQQSFNSISEE